MLAQLVLRKNAERRLRGGHVWIYSNEVDTQRSPLSEFEPGQAVTVTLANGRAWGSAYINPHSLICARLYSRKAERLINKKWLQQRMEQALALREQLFSAPCYRLVYGESDGLPGLVVDRFDSVLVVQIGTAGMEQHKAAIIDALQACLPATRAIVLRNESRVREQENLPLYSEVASGSLPEQIFLEENGARFHVSVLEGQKTGWFYDHRLNRQRAAQYAAGQRVLDVFSYVGAWGVQAALAGANEVVCVDSSAAALEQVSANAALNQVAEKISSQRGDAFEVLKNLRQEEEKFDLVILDPPAFIKRRKDQKQGELAYRRINQAAIQVLRRGGILVSASCSLHLPREHLLNHLQAAALHLDRRLQILERGGQGPDHPVHPAIAETDYLKSMICRLL